MINAAGRVVRDNAISLAETVQKPLRVEGGNIGSAAGADNHKTNVQKNTNPAIRVPVKIIASENRRSDKFFRLKISPSKIYLYLCPKRKQVSFEIIRH